jgi:hypothetical protein
MEISIVRRVDFKIPVKNPLLLNSPETPGIDHGGAGLEGHLLFYPVEKNPRHPGTFLLAEGLSLHHRSKNAPMEQLLRGKGEGPEIFSERSPPLSGGLANHFIRKAGPFGNAVAFGK